MLAENSQQKNKIFIPLILDNDLSKFSSSKHQSTFIACI